MASIQFIHVTNQVKTIFKSVVSIIGIVIPKNENLFNPKAVASGGGNADGPPSPEIGKFVVEIWCYLVEIYTFGEESEIQEIFSKKCEKMQFSMEILIKKYQKFLEIFQTFLRS